MLCGWYQEEVRGKDYLIFIMLKLISFKLRNIKALLMFVALDRYFHIGFVSNMWKSSLMPLRTYEIHFNKVIIKVNILL
jgi:hypothetical protein